MSDSIKPRSEGSFLASLDVAPESAFTSREFIFLIRNFFKHTLIEPSGLQRHWSYFIEKRGCLDEQDVKVYSIVNSFFHYRGVSTPDFDGQICVYAQDPLTKSFRESPSDDSQVEGEASQELSQEAALLRELLLGRLSEEEEYLFNPKDIFWIVRGLFHNPFVRESVLYKQLKEVVGGYRPLKREDFKICSIINSFISSKGRSMDDFVGRVLLYPNSSPRIFSGVSTLPSFVFGALQWHKYFNVQCQGVPLPEDIMSILESPCPFFPDSKVGDTHYLTLIPGEMNLRSFESLILNVKGRRGAKFKDKRYAGCGEAFDRFGDLSSNPEHWALMTKGVIPESREKTWAEQQHVAERYRSQGYEIPSVLDASIILLLQTVQGKIHPYVDNPCTYTRCQETDLFETPDSSLAIGSFSPEGLGIIITTQAAVHIIGLGLTRKFF